MMCSGGSQTWFGNKGEIPNQMDKSRGWFRKTAQITALEVKSSMTYNKDFEITLKKLPGWIKTPVRRRAVVYTGDFENHAGEIEIMNYMSLTL